MPDAKIPPACSVEAKAPIEKNEPREVRIAPVDRAFRTKRPLMETPLNFIGAGRRQNGQETQAALRRCSHAGMAAICIIAASLSSGCSQWLDHSKPVITAYMSTVNTPKGDHLAGHGVPRSAVIKQFGSPVASKVFHPPVTVHSARARRIGSTRPPDWYLDADEIKDSDRIGRIDEFWVRGPIAGDGEGEEIVEEIDRDTLGLAEILFFPADLFDYVWHLPSITRVRVFYFPNDTYLYQINDNYATRTLLRERL